MEWFTADQVAEQLHCAKFTIQRDMRSGALKASKPGRSWITKQEWIDSLQGELEAVKNGGWD